MSAVLGIDIGSATCILATIKQGVMTVVTNEISARKTPALVGYTDAERLLGESALSLIKSNYANTCCHMKMLLGRRASRDALQGELSHLVTETAEGLASQAAYKVKYKGNSMEVTALESMAALLTKLKETGAAFLRGEVKDVVISVPGWYTDVNKKAMIDAARVADLNCLRVSTDHVATAVDYGMYRNSQFNTEEYDTVAFVSMGHCTTSVSIWQFKKSHAKLLAETSNPNLGGRDMNTLLINKMASEFLRQTGNDPRNNPKALIKLQAEAARGKIVLSANTEAVFSCEYLMGEEDYMGTVTREEFEAMCSDLVAELKKMIEKVMEESKLQSIDSVEIVGGSLRVPWVQQAVREAFNLEARGLDVMKTLNMEETVARGCTLQAAMLSRAFKTSEYTVVDRVKNGIVLAFSAAHNGKHQSEVQQVVFATGSKISIVGHTTTLTYNTCQDFTLTASYQHPTALLPGVDPQIGVFSIALPPHSNTNSGVEKKVEVVARLDGNGIFSIDRAVVCESKEVERVVREKHIPSVEVTDTPMAEPSTGTEGGDDVTPDASAEDKCEYVDVVHKETVVEKIELDVKRAPRACYLTKAQMDDLVMAERSMVKDDNELRDARQEMNTLESYIYNLRSRMSNELAPFATAIEREAIGKAVNDTEQWLFDNVGMAKGTYVDKRTQLANISERPVYRYEESRTRDHLVQRLHTSVERHVAACNSQDAAYSHIAQDKKKALAAYANDCLRWASEQVSIQLNAPKDVDPKLTCAMIKERIKELNGMAERTLTEPPPPPPPPKTSQQAPPPPASGDDPTQPRSTTEPTDQNMGDVPVPPPSEDSSMEGGK